VICFQKKNCKVKYVRVRFDVKLQMLLEAGIIGILFANNFANVDSDFFKFIERLSHGYFIFRDTYGVRVN